MTIGGLDIYRTAKLLMQQYGDDAPLIAARRADALLDLGNIEGQRVWKAILKAVEDLCRGEPSPGEPIH